MQGVDGGVVKKQSLSEQQSGKRVLLARRCLKSLSNQTRAAHLRKTHDDMEIGRRTFAIQTVELDSR